MWYKHSVLRDIRLFLIPPCQDEMTPKWRSCEMKKSFRFLHVFAKFRKANVTFGVPVLLSVRV